MQQDDNDDYGFSGSNENGFNAENGSNKDKIKKDIMKTLSLFRELPEDKKKEAVRKLIDDKEFNVQVKLELPDGDEKFISFRDLVEEMGEQEAFEILFSAMQEEHVQCESFSKQEILDAAKAVNDGNATERQKLIIKLIKSSKTDKSDNIIDIVLDAMSKINAIASMSSDVLLPILMTVTINYLYDKNAELYPKRSCPEKAFNAMDTPIDLIDKIMKKLLDNGMDKTTIFLGALSAVIRFGTETLKDVPLQDASIIAKELGLPVPKKYNKYGISMEEDNSNDDGMDDDSLINDFCGSNDDDDEESSKGKPSNKSIKSMMMDI
jgi:hypothetical protein